MSIERLYVIGAGGHAKVVLDALSRAKYPVSAVEVIDDAPQKSGRCILGWRISPWPSAHKLKGTCFHLAIGRSEEHTSELQSLMRISYAVFCLQKKKKNKLKKRIPSYI